MKFRHKLIFFAIGLIGIGILLWQADLPNVKWQEIFNEDTWLLLLGLVGIWLVIYVLHTIAYKIILHEESKHVRFLSMFKICAAGFALNSVTPAGLVGGEPYRIMELRRYCSTEKATSSTLTFSLMYTFGHVLLWITTAAVVIVRMILGKPQILWVSILALVAGGLLFILFIIFLIFRKNGFAYPVMKFLSKLPLLRKKLPAVVEKNKASYIEIDDNIREFRNKPVRFISTLLLEYSTRLLEALEYFILLWFFTKASGLAVHYFDGVLLMGVASLVGNILFIIPMQAASREGGMALALSFIVTDAALIGTAGFGIGFFYRVREFIFIVFGIILVLVGKRGKKVFKDEITGNTEQLVKDEEANLKELEQTKTTDQQ